jgi:hypothetical protein
MFLIKYNFDQEILVKKIRPLAIIELEITELQNFTYWDNSFVHMGKSFCPYGSNKKYNVR